MSNRIPFSVMLTGLLLYLLTIGPFTSYMSNKPIEEKLGSVLSIKLLKPLSADQKELVGASLVFKVMMYYGGVLANAQVGRVISDGTDLQGMSRLLHGAAKLDPYNMDIYYLAQGFLTWDAHQFKVANDLLEYGMTYRDWDWQLPYFAAFNNAYFLKDYKAAAKYYQKAGELNGSDLHIALASRYLQEVGQTELAITYLTGMLKAEKNNSIKLSYETRLNAFYEVLRIENARNKYLKSFGALPASIKVLIEAGFLNSVPIDPYGGSFYLKQDGSVATTSKFAFNIIK